MKRLVFWSVLLLATGALFAGCASTSMEPRESIERRIGLAPEETAPMSDTDAWRRWDTHGPRRLRSSIGMYFRNRVLDFSDMFEAGLSFGKWAKIEADYGIGFYGFGATDIQRWRLGQRSIVENEETTVISTLPFPASLILAPSFMMDDKAQATIITLGGVNYEREEAIWPAAIHLGIKPSVERVRMTGIERDTDRHRFAVTGHSFPVGAELHLGIGARARVYPLQLFDFVAGIFGWDLLKDDAKY